MPITVKADKVQPPANVGLVRWQIDQDPSRHRRHGDAGPRHDDRGTGGGHAEHRRDVPLDLLQRHQRQRQARSRRGAAGAADGDRQADAAARRHLQPDQHHHRRRQSREHQRRRASTPMVLRADILLEGGGANRKFGIDQVTLGNVGNCRSDDFVVELSWPPGAARHPQRHRGGGSRFQDQPGGRLPRADARFGASRHRH